MLTEGSSKFTRHESTADSDEGSEFSILAEIERGNIIESDNSDDQLISPPDIPDNSKERAIPELLADSFDLAEFDDDDLILEDSPMPSSKAKGLSQAKTQSQVLDRRKGNVKSTNGLTSSSRGKKYRPQSPPSHRRSRSRSPILARKRSNSPRSHKRRTSPHRRQSPPHRRQSPPTDRRRSPAKLFLNSQVNQSSNHSHRRKDSGDHNVEMSPNKFSPNEQESQVDNTSPIIPDPLEDPLLTKEERETLLNRKKKFSKDKKISSTKKTIKLKKTKKKTSISKRLGAKKVVKKKSKSPEIVETVALDTEDTALVREAKKPEEDPPPVKKGQCFCYIYLSELMSFNF